MAEERRKIQLEAEVVAETSDLERVKQTFQEIAQAGQQAGQQATQGLKAVGDASEDLTRRQSALLQQIERTAIKTTEGNAAWLAHRAAIEGVSAQAAPFLERLRSMEQAQTQLGMSAKATAAAMRGVPAQITDIVTSLQGGQRPMTVLLQQGGQLKDMFGGIGPAARALGGYVAGLINPFTLGAAAIATVAVGAHQGAEEMRAFQNAVLLSGNAFAASVSQFAQLRDSLVAIAGTRGKAAEVLTEIARTGQLAGANVRGIAEAAILMEKATGQAVSKTLADFVKLAEEPAKAAVELNKQYNFLTASVFAHIRALEEQGQRAKAADVAEQALADTLKTRAAGVVENVGLMERAWRGLAGAAKSAWDRMLDIGREKSLPDRFAELSNQVAKGQGAFDPSAFGGNAEARAQLAANRSAMQSVFRQMEIEQRNTTATVENAAANRAAVDAVSAIAKANDQYASKTEKLNKALGDYRRELAAIRAIPETERSKEVKALLDPATIRRTEQGIRDQFRETGGESDLSGAAARRRILVEENARRQRALATLDFSQPLNLTESEKKVIEIEEKLKTSLDAVTRSREQKALQTARDTVESDRNRAAQDKQIDGAKKALETITRQAETAGQQADAIQQQALSQEAANATFGKSATAIQEMVLAQLRLQAAEADSSDTFDPRYVAGLQKKVEAQQRYVDALKESEAQQIRVRQTEQGRALQEDTQTLQLEVSLLGRSREERERILAQRRVEVELAKELADIDRSGASDPDKEALRIRARANAAQKAETAASRATLDEWQRTADSIENSLTEALLRGFESGKDFASNFRDTLKNMFGTLVLRPVIQAVMAPVSGALAGIGQQIGGSITGAGGSGLSGLASAGSSLFGGGVLSGASTLGMFGQAAGASISNGLIGGFGANMANVGALASGGELLGALGAAAPYLAIGLLAVSLLTKPGGGPKTESGFGTGVPLRGDPAAARQIADAIQQQYRSIAGSAAQDLQLGVFSAQDPKGTAQTQLAVEAILNGRSISSRGGRLGGIENVGRSPEELAAAVTEESERVVLHALQATRLPDKIGAYLRQLGDVDKLSGGALHEAVTKLQAAMTQRQTLEAQLFDLTHTELERLAEARRKERDAIDDTNRALFDHVAALTDLTTAQNTARDSLLTAFQTQGDTLRGVIERNQNAAQQLRDLRDSFSVDGLSAAQRRALAAGNFNSTLTGAIGGNEQALQNIGGASKDFIDAVKASARSPVEVAAAVARVQAGLTTAATAAEGRATVAQQQLDTMTSQLNALGLLNTSVLTVGDAMTAYLAAQTQIQQEQLRYTTQMAADQAVSDAAISAAAAVVAGTTPAVAAAQDRNTIVAAMIAANAASTFTNAAATGGYRSGVVRVGERGQEVVDFETPGRVYTNEQTRGMFSSNAALEPLLRQIVQTLQAGNENRRREAVAMIAPLAKIDARQRKWDTQGIPLGEDMLAGAAQ